MRNPLLVFKLVQRVANFLKDMEGEQERIPGFFFWVISCLVIKYAWQSQLVFSRKIQGLPLAALAEQYEGENAFTEDLGEVAHAILRIHFIYDLNVTDVSPTCFHALHL